MTNQVVYICTFETNVENTKRLSGKYEVLSCVYSPHIPGDALITVVVPNKEEVIDLPFVSRSDNYECSVSRGGGMAVWKNYGNYESFRGPNQLNEMIEEFSL